VGWGYLADMAFDEPVCAYARDLHTGTTVLIAGSPLRLWRNVDCRRGDHRRFKDHLHRYRLERRPINFQSSALGIAADGAALTLANLGAEPVFDGFPFDPDPIGFRRITIEGVRIYCLGIQDRINIQRFKHEPQPWHKAFKRILCLLAALACPAIRIHDALPEDG